MTVVPWGLITLNVIGAGIMVKFGLPKEVPLVGRQDADPLIGYLGLVLFGTSLAVRIAITVTS